MSKKALNQVRTILSRECNSFSRLPRLLHIYEEGYGLTDKEFLTVLGEEWSGFDNISQYGVELYDILGRGVLPQMMTADERAALAALPETVTLYRGAEKGVSEEGFSWTLDREIAVRFATGLLRYQKKHPVLVTASVKREDIVAVKLDRKEAEVIVQFEDVEVTSVVDLPPSPLFARIGAPAAKSASKRRSGRRAT